MDLEHLLPGIIGAFVGVIGWLAVGLFIQRRQFIRQARNAARAVYFELDVNRMNVEVARDYGSFTPLNRSSFERLLPELATLIAPGELRTIVSAYIAHAGYQQAASDQELPPAVRREALSAILDAHRDALDVLRRRAFSRAEIGALEAQESRAAARENEPSEPVPLSRRT
jgi:hypothetical protein